MEDGKLAIEKVNGGYLAQPVNSYYSAYGQATVYSDFVELIRALAARFGEDDIARTIESSQALTAAFAGFISCTIAPQLLAIESKVNPGVENVVPDNIEF